MLIGGGVTSDEPQLLEMSAHILTWLGAAYGLIYRQQIFSSFISLWGARVLVAVSSHVSAVKTIRAKAGVPVTFEMRKGTALRICFLNFSGSKS